MMYKLSFVVFFVCLVAAHAMSDECVKGEHYWCSSMENALKCSAFKHCAATVWKNDISDNNELFDKCQVCTKFLTDVKLVIKDEPLRKALKVLLREKICPLFGDYESTCRVVVEHYADQILDLIASEIVMCEFLHMCLKRESGGLSGKGHLNKLTGGCETCKFFINELKDYIGAHPTRETIEEALEKLCEALPESYRKVCDDFVAKYSDMIIDLILQNLDAQLICEKLHFCPNNGCPEKINSIDKCEICEITFSFLEGLLEKNSTVEQIETAAHKVCHLLPCQYREPLLNLCNGSKSNRYYKCISGPKYWCASEANAKLCEAEDHCRRHVWK